MKELREFIRYSLEAGSRSSAFVEVEGVNSLCGIISDLSTGGFSFVIDIKDFADKKFDLEKFFFVRINFKGISINAEVEKKWGLVKNADSDKIFIAGVGFNIISSEDRLRLNGIIENLRSESSPHLLKSVKQSPLPCYE